MSKRKLEMRMSSHRFISLIFYREKYPDVVFNMINVHVFLIYGKATGEGTIKI